MDPRQLSDDFRDFLTSLNEACVDYLVVGGHAVAYHGYVRPTRDMDVWIAVTPQNAARLVKAVNGFFGAELNWVTKEWFLDADNVTRIGAVPNLVEILPSISGPEFADAYSRRVSGMLDGLEVAIISLADLRANKLASGRHKDLADLENLPEA